MPQGLATSTAKCDFMYAIVPQKLMKRLGEKKASGSTYQVCMALLSYSFGKDSCFPSHKTIQVWLGGKGSIALSTIRKALKWLEDHAFIKRNHRRSKKRYQLFIDRPSSSKESSAGNIQVIKNQFVDDQIKDDRLANDPGKDDHFRGVSVRNDHEKKEEAHFDHQPCLSFEPTESTRYERSSRSDTNVAHKSKPEENSKPPISPVQAQGTVKGNDDSSKKQNRTWRTPEQRRKSKDERRLLRAEKQRQEQKQQEEHSEWHRSKRLEKLTMAIALSKILPVLEFQSDLEHLEPYVQNYLESISSEALIVLKITDKQVFMRLVKHLIWIN